MPVYNGYCGPSAFLRLHFGVGTRDFRHPIWVAVHPFGRRPRDPLEILSSGEPMTIRLLDARSSCDRSPVSDEPGVPCPVCGALNPEDLENCGACGFSLKESGSGERVDALLEGVLDLSTGPPAPAASDASEVDEPDDIDQEVAEQLFDSLLVEIQPSEHDSPSEDAVSPPPSQVAESAPQDFGGVERVPVLATPAETEGRKLTRISGRMMDLVTFGGIAGLVGVFVYFRMYANPFDPTNLLPLILFAAVAAASMAAGAALFHVSNSEVAQGDRLVKSGRYQDALAHYERAIRIVRRPSYAWTSRGVAMKYLGRLDEALRCHENAIRLDAENEVAWCNLGTVYFKRGQLGKALDCYDKAIGIRPRYAIAWNNKGVVFARMNRFAEADKCHAKATKLRPEYVAAWLNRGEVLARLGSREQAQQCLERARSISRRASAPA